MLRKELGEITNASVPGELAAAYEKLMSPLHALDIGELCYFNGSSPPGRVATRALVKARREDLLRNVLHGPNPEARLYAARGLRDLSALSTSDQAVLDKLLKLNLPVYTCGGCIVSRDSSKEAWSSLDKDPL